MCHGSRKGTFSIKKTCIANVKVSCCADVVTIIYSSLNCIFGLSIIVSALVFFCGKALTVFWRWGQDSRLLLRQHTSKFSFLYTALHSFRLIYPHSVRSIHWSHLTVQAYLHELNQFFHFSDTPTTASANNGNTSTSQSNNDLDIFGPMVSNPLPASTSVPQFTQVNEQREKGKKSLLCM